MIRKKMRPLFLLAGLVLLVLSSWAVAEGTDRPLMRYPDIHKDHIVFVHAGDIWRVSSQGGIAQRLTIHDGDEVQPKFSPDGQLIAFSGEYDGNTDVYVMNIHGGDIKRLTFHPGNDLVVGWHPVKNKICFVSGRSHFRFTKMYLINPDGTGLEEMIMHNISRGSFSPDGKQMAYNRVSREGRTWKRYVGGTAQEVYLYNLETDEEINLTNFEGTDRIPMWIGDKVYFSSDRDGVLNIYSADPSTREIAQLTQYTEYDARRPSMGGHEIIYELGGSLEVLDVNTGETRKVPVTIKADNPETRPYIQNVRDFITHVDCSPSGKRALITARGEVFSAPKENGRVINLSENCGTRDKDAVWSPDGKSVAWLSDASGEYDIWMRDARGNTDAVKLTSMKDGFRHTLRWSPDGQHIAFTDQTLTLYLLNVSSKKITRVDKAEYEHVDVASQKVKPIYDFAWSPCGGYIAYSKMTADHIYQVYIYDVAAKKVHLASSGLFNDFHPAFSSDGKYLFFASHRRFNPSFCDMEWEMIYKNTTGIYYLTLQKEGDSLFPLKQDVEIETESEATPEKTAGIDFDGLAQRIESLPLPGGNYRFLKANKNRLFYLNGDDGDYNRFAFRDLGPQDLCAFDLEDGNAVTVLGGIDRYNLSADGETVVYQQGRDVGLISASATESAGNPLDLAELEMRIDPKSEWKQLFTDAWRIERDFFYEPGMHGYDWPAIRDKYAKLLPYTSCREDIRYLIGEMISELNAGHLYSFGGDGQRSGEYVNVGLLGVDWSVDTKNNRYRFGRILRTPDWSRDSWPPLAKPGLDIRDGDYLLAVNGKPVTADENIYQCFQNTAGKQMTLTVNSKPGLNGAREVNVKPVRSEYLIRYNDWVEQNRLLVEKKSGGKIGYLHMPDTFTGSGREFGKYFYGQSKKAGLIVDGRFNGGGLDPDIFLNRIKKRTHSFWTRRYSHDQSGPVYSVDGHKVCITNRQAGSGGDELPWEFQEFGMGPVIGTRTWGGLIGYSATHPLMDGGGITAADYRIYNSRGEWVVENTGVTPDIEIDLHPAEMAKGIDAQLMKAIEVLMEKIESEPFQWPKHEPYPRYNRK